MEGQGHPNVSTFFIATRHQEYANHRFPPGSTVIDPFRYIPDQPGVTVKRIGQNRPALISVLLPSRGRPDLLNEMLASLWATVAHKRFVEVLVYVDTDEIDSYFSKIMHPVQLHFGPRRLLSECWNELADLCGGEILMHAGDDLVFRTPGWDQQVRDAFAAVPDRIALVQGDDLSPNRDALATHGFVHRKWVDAVGHFLPPLFSCDWNDVWLTEVADQIGRRIKVPAVIEHNHYSFEKRPMDKTDQEREERGREDDVVGLYQRTAKERLSDVAKLRAVMV